ncbi:MAG: chromosome segregation protein SMC [Bacteroidetes bacterium QS_9_68_14]|nr:MAG: chromosome segregation protein SMC [Bacteroidetes bacterium QS_9_68_14]
MRVSEIHLQNWKNFKEASASLSRRVFIIGPNASGKSNFLDAFRFLRDVADDGLHQAVKSRGGVTSVRCLAARRSPNIVVGVTLSGGDGREMWHYELEFNQDVNRGPEVRREEVVDLRSGNEQVVERPNSDDREDEMLLTQTALEQIAENRKFREVADFFEAVSYQHIIPQVVREPQEFSPGRIKEDDPFGRDFLQRVWDKNEHTRQAWLRRIGNALESVIDQLTDLEVNMDQHGTPHLVARFEHWRVHDAKQQEWQLSDGTLRLFGLMWAVFEGSGPLLLEEPELSVHSEIVGALAQLFEQLQEEIRKMKRTADYEKRQLIISTHAVELLRDAGIGAEEVIWIEPSSEGSRLRTPNNEQKKALMNGLSVADVILPMSSPADQLTLDF